MRGEAFVAEVGRRTGLPEREAAAVVRATLLTLAQRVPGATASRLAAEVEVAGRKVSIQGAGNGPIDAFVEALGAASGETIRVLDYHEHAIGSGANAQAVAYLELRVDDRKTLFGVGMDANIVTASLRAIISGIERAETASTGAAGAEKVSNA